MSDGLLDKTLDGMLDVSLSEVTMLSVVTKASSFTVNVGTFDGTSDEDDISDGVSEGVFENISDGTVDGNVDGVSDILSTWIGLVVWPSSIPISPIIGFCFTDLKLITSLPLLLI